MSALSDLESGYVGFSIIKTFNIIAIGMLLGQTTRLHLQIVTFQLILNGDYFII